MAGFREQTARFVRPARWVALRVPATALLLVVTATIVAAVACGSGEAARPSARAGVAVDASRAASTTRATRPAILQYEPASWMAKLSPPMAGELRRLACLDANGDGRLNVADSDELEGVDIPIVRRDTCLPPALSRRGEWFVAEPDPPLTCDAPGRAPLLVIAIGGGGTDLLDRNEGVSVGLIDMVNGIRAQAAGASVPAGVVLMASAINFSDLPQTRMAQWLAAYLRHRFDAMPCLRAALMGHSHGAVVVTSVMATLEAQYADRLFGVVLDRSLLYYDPGATELPVTASLLNVYQTNEGWHGDPIASANVVNFDASAESAPRDERESPLPVVPVEHPSLDDSIGVQRRVVEAVVAWAKRD